MNHSHATTRHGGGWRHAVAATWRPLAGVLAALTLLLSTACGSLPGSVHRPSSLAETDVAATDLARLAAAATPHDKRELSGLALLGDAAPALQARLALARRAQKSLDLQYYLIAGDDTGRALLRELRDAAARGVRVRLLVDDLHAADAQELLAALAGVEHIEVRLFNPLPARSGAFASRVLLSLHDFERINRRMHNKLFIADNSWAVTGGRNIGDEYFMRGDVANFVDMDLLSSGPVVRELSTLFDQFWNSELSFPIASIVEAAATPQQAGERFDRLAQPRSPQDTGEPGPSGWQLDAAAAALVYAPVIVYADSPAKALRPSDGQAAATAMERTLALYRSARSEALIASPYFIPGERGMALMREALDNGIRISVTTNSLAATDEPLAHWGYARYRLDMLKMGVSVAERRPGHQGSSAKFGEFRSSLSRLHAKLGVIDRRWLMVGSMNMDLRSSRTNTELGLAIDSTELAAQVAQLMQQRWAPSHYQLKLADTGRQVVWLEPDGQGTRTHSAEPQLNWLARTRLGLLSMFISEDLL